MEKDMHYYGILALARAAGYSREEAHTIAYASQYVDDAEDYGLIRLGDGNVHTPITTKHIGPNAYFGTVQRGVYISFHFIPPRRKGDGKFVFPTEPNSIFVNELLEEVAREQDALLRLVRIGVALHTYADTWSHQGFSGRKSQENDVENCSVLEQGRYEPIDAGYDILPKIGHIQAEHCPDRTHLVWRYDAPGQGKTGIERNNSAEFLVAARRIHGQLCRFRGVPDDGWGSLEPDVAALLATEADIEDKYSAWKNSGLLQDFFGPGGDEAAYDYSETAWRDSALIPFTAAPEKFAPPSRVKWEARGDFWASDYGRFQRAAERQRDFVLTRIA